MGTGDLIRGQPCEGLASHPGGETGISSSLMGHLARMQTFVTLLSSCGEFFLFTKRKNVLSYLARAKCSNASVISQQQDAVRGRCTNVEVKVTLKQQQNQKS